MFGETEEAAPKTDEDKKYSILPLFLAPQLLSLSVFDDFIVGAPLWRFNIEAIIHELYTTGIC